MTAPRWLHGGSKVALSQLPRAQDLSDPLSFQTEDGEGDLKVKSAAKGLEKLPTLNLS